jgi:amidohydrolase
MFSDDEGWAMALAIHKLAETGSKEYESSKILEDLLEKEGFTVERGYSGIPTAFRATKYLGSPGPTVAFLAEYDALPGVGHACGHNIIAVAAVLAALKTSRTAHHGSVAVYGTPDEEGSGEFAGSKILLAEKNCFAGVDAALMTHPGTSWSLGSPSLAVQDLRVTFKGYASHEAASPEKGVSALDAAILTYTAVNMMRQHVRRDMNVVIHGVIREGGQASNVTPDKAVLVYGLRSSDSDYLEELIKKFRLIVQGCSLATNASYTIDMIGPMFSSTKFSFELMKAGEEALRSLGIEPKSLAESTAEIPKGSTDFANISQRVPSLEITSKIAPEGTPWHSEMSARAASSEEGRVALRIASDALSKVAQRLLDEPAFLQRVKLEFEGRK